MTKLSSFPGCQNFIQSIQDSGNYHHPDLESPPMVDYATSPRHLSTALLIGFTLYQLLPEPLNTSLFSGALLLSGQNYLRDVRATKMSGCSKTLHERVQDISEENGWLKMTKRNLSQEKRAHRVTV